MVPKLRLLRPGMSGCLPATTMRPCGDRLHGPGGDELGQRRFRDADVAADLAEPDTPFRDQPPGKALGGTEQIGSLSNRQQPINRLAHMITSLMHENG
jgi:hypothetical protein